MAPVRSPKNNIKTEVLKNSDNRHTTGSSCKTETRHLKSDNVSPCNSNSGQIVSSPVKRPIEMLTSASSDNFCKKLNNSSNNESSGSLSRISHMIGSFLSKNDSSDVSLL